MSTPRHEHYDRYLLLSFSEEGRAWVRAHRKSVDMLYVARGYLNGAIAQFNRMSDDLNAWQVIPRTSGRMVIYDPAEIRRYLEPTELFDLDANFYLNCWFQIGKFLNLFHQAWLLPETEEAWGSVSRLFVQAKGARTYYEHRHRRFLETGIESRGSSLGPEGYTFHYPFDTPAGEEKRPNVPLGRAELDRVISVYEQTLAVVEAAARGGPGPSVINATKST